MVALSRSAIFSFSFKTKRSSLGFGYMSEQLLELDEARPLSRKGSPDRTTVWRGVFLASVVLF